MGLVNTIKLYYLFNYIILLQKGHVPVPLFFVIWIRTMDHLDANSRGLMSYVEWKMSTGIETNKTKIMVFLFVITICGTVVCL